jgi:hypothetical protein
MDEMSLVIVVFRHGRLLRLIQSDGTAIFLNSLSLDVTTGLSNVTLAGDAFKPWPFFTGRMKLMAFVDARTTLLVLCFDGSLLMRFKMFWTKGRMATDMRTTPGDLAYSYDWRICSIL